MRCASDSVVGRALVLAFCFLSADAVLLPSRVAAQRVSPKPAVYVREVHIDSLLLVFGVDSNRVRTAVVNALRGAGRLAPEPGIGVPALDVDVTVLRLAVGGTPDPAGFVRVEVGRNLMEAGSARSLIWQGMQDLVPAPTWRELSRGTLSSVLRVVNNFLMDRGGGA
jgi:hypothetical protein